MDRLHCVLCLQDEPAERRRLPEVLDAVMYSPECLTVTFNIARLRESEKRFQEAMTRYAGILERYPEYTSCTCAAC